MVARRKARMLVTGVPRSVLLPRCHPGAIMEKKDTPPEQKDKPATQKKPDVPAAAKGWPAPKNTFAPKQRAMDRKPGSRGSARGR